MKPSNEITGALILIVFGITLALIWAYSPKTAVAPVTPEPGPQSIAPTPAPTITPCPNGETDCKG